jgi:hypothetical protein
MQAFQIMTIAALAGQFATGQSAKGFIKIGEDRRELRYVRAARVPDLGNPSKQVLLVMLSESLLSPKTVFDLGLRLIRSDSESNQVVMFTFDNQGVSWTVRHKSLEAGFSSFAHSPNPFPFQLNAGKIEGRVEYQPKPPFTEPIQVSVTYSAFLEKEPADPLPTPADAAAARQSAPAKVFLDQEDALEKGDRARFLATLRAKSRRKLEQEDFKQALPNLRYGPKNLKVLKAVEEDREATLWISGIQDGKPCKGKAHLEIEGTNWVVLTSQCQ